MYGHPNIFEKLEFIKNYQIEMQKSKLILCHHFSDIEVTI